MLGDQGAELGAAPEVEDAGARCVSCGTRLHGPHCHMCGERVVSPDDVRVTAFVRRLVGATFDLDSRLWRSFRTLLTQPGLLTAEYMRGRRQPYLSPLQVFLLANLLFFTVLSTIGGFSTFTTQLRYHTGQPGYGAIAERLISRHGESDTPERRAYTARFDEATPRYANSMIVLMVPLFGGVLWLLYAGRRYYAHQLVLSLHFHAFLLIALVALSLLLRTIVAISARAVEWADSELVLGLLLLLIFAGYLAASFRRGFGDRMRASLLRGAAAALLLLPVVILYRMLLFFVVYYMVD